MFENNSNPYRREDSALDIIRDEERNKKVFEQVKQLKIAASNSNDMRSGGVKLKKAISNGKRSDMKIAEGRIPNLSGQQ